MGAAATGEVALGDDGQARRGHGDAVVQRGDDDAPAGPGEVGGVAVDDRQVDAMVEHHFAEPPRRTGAIGGDDDPESVGEQLGETASQPRPVAGDRSPTGRLDDRGVRRLRGRVDRPERIDSGGEQAVRLGVQPGEGEVALASPRRRQRGGEVVLLGEQVDGAVAAATWLDEHDLGLLGQHVGEQCRLAAVVEPREPALHPFEERSLGDPFPLLSPPRLEGDEALGRGPARRRWGAALGRGRSAPRRDRRRSVGR